MTSEPADGAQVQLHYRELAEQLPNSAVYIFDGDLRVVFAGGSLMAKSRWPQSSLLGRGLADLMPPATFAQAEPHLRATLAGEERAYELAYPTGESFDVRSAPLLGKDGSTHNVLVVALDITARKRAEESERVLEKRLRLAMQAANVGLWDWDLATNRVYYSHEWKHQLGYDEDEIGDDFGEWEQRVHPDDLAQARDTALRYVAAPWPNYEQEFRMRHKDGTYHWILTQAALLYDEDGRAIHMLGSHIDITEKKRAELALAEAERYARATLDGLAAHIAIIDVDGTIIAANRAWRDFGAVNLPANTTAANSASNLCEGANYAAVCRAAAAAGCTEAQQWLDGMEAVLAGKTELAEFEYACHSPGEQRWFVVRISRMPGDAPLRLVVAHENITQRKRSELAVAESEAALKRSQQVAHVGHWTWDVRTNAVTWSDEAKRIYGLDPATHYTDLQQVLDRTIHPDDAEWVRAQSRALQAEHRRLEAEYRVVWPDGSVHYVHVMPGDTTVDEHGNFVQLSGVVQDITERKLRDLEREELVHQLQDKADQLAQVMHSVPEGVLLLDNLGCVLLANPRAQQMLTLLGEYGEQQRLVRLGGTLLESFLTSPPMGQWHILRVGQRYYEIIAHLLETGPLPGGWVLVLHDATIEHAVQEQLQRQERLAAVGQLAAGIAHDFNNIMTVISIYAELLGGAPSLTEKERARTQAITEHAQRATRMIRQILDFSRQSVFERQKLDLLPLLKEEVKLLRQTLPENIEIVLAAPPGEYFVQADPTRLQQLVMNLAVNARDALPAGGRLTFDLSHLQLGQGDKPPLPGMAAGDWLRLLVADTGTGITPDHLVHIFEPFFTTKELGKGTGLGLAQVHGIVALHDGHITVASEPRAGTTFTIYLPAAAAPENLRAAAMAHALLPQGHGQSILVVEDDAAVRSSIVDLLVLWHYRVAQAANGEEALDHLLQAGGQVDLIISDVIMPRLGGIGLVKALEQNGVRTPVILMSGHAPGEDRAGLAEAVVAAWLDKPPSTWLLAKAVAQALGN